MDFGKAKMYKLLIYSLVIFLPIFGEEIISVPSIVTRTEWEYVHEIENPSSDVLINPSQITGFEIESNLIKLVYLDFIYDMRYETTYASIFREEIIELSERNPDSSEDSGNSNRNSYYLSKNKCSFLKINEELFLEPLELDGIVYFSILERNISKDQVYNQKKSQSNLRNHGPPFHV